MATEQTGAQQMPFSADERDRLRTFVRYDVITSVTGVVVIVGAYLVIDRNEWLPVLAALVAVAGAIIALGYRPAGRGDLEGGVRYVAAGNWFIALAVPVIATFAWPVLTMAALLPAVVAPPYVPRKRLGRYLVVSVAVAVGATAIGVLQDVTGFTDELPSWLPSAVLIFFTPFIAWMMVEISLQNSTRLQAALEEQAAQAASLQASRVRLVEATDRIRRQVERDLHDGAQQRLVALGLALRLAEDQCVRDPAGTAATLAGLRDEVHAARAELRDLAHGVYPSVLSQHGLADALAAAADRCPIPVRLRAIGVGRYPPPVEAAIYFCCVEALQNAAKHAGDDARIDLTLTRDGDRLRFAIADDGAGFDPDLRRTGDGFDNMRDRLGAAGGTLDVDSHLGAGTTVAGWLPVAPTLGR
jgi:signal transduction histidine kinase